MTCRIRVPRVGRFLAMLFLMQVTVCAGMDVVRLTNVTFAPKVSAESIEVLVLEPTRLHVRLTELHMEYPPLSFASMPERLLTKATRLGADAVVFAKPVRQIEHQIAYAPVYDPWV